jgi:hypothetical protein
MPPADEGEAPSRQRDTASPAPAVLTAALSPPAPSCAVEALERNAARAVPANRVAAPVAEQATVAAPHAPSLPSPVAPAPVRAVVVERSGVPAVTEHPAAAGPLPVQPRQARIAPAPPEMARTPPPGGALLPASAPVFAAVRAAPAPPGRSVAARVAAARAEGSAAAMSEPVVHVSIGRLEVRAAPAAAAPSRRREEPRPSSLDDYLRQRGKVTP